MQLDRSHVDDSCAACSRGRLTWSSDESAACSREPALDRAAQTCAMRHSDSG